MQYQHIGHQIKGFYHIAKWSQRVLAMNSDKAKHKLNVLAFWDKHGLDAALDAFKISRRTAYLWKAQLKSGQGKPASLEEGSKRPHQVRKRHWPNAVVDEIKRLRRAHPNLGKEKIYLFLNVFCDTRDLRCPKPRTIGRLIADQPNKLRARPKRLTPKGKVKVARKVNRTYKPKGFKARYPGHCCAFDTIEKHIDGYRRYIITFTDIYSRFALAFATTSHGSLAARSFFLLVAKLFPYRIETVLTDGGSEFKKSFKEELLRQHKQHWQTYPRTPKMNAHNERFNRTIQEEYIDYHENELMDPHSFNHGMVDYLLWYNAQRPHWSLKLKSPLQFLTIKHQQQCNMYWPNTRAYFLLYRMVSFLGPVKNKQRALPW